MSRYSGGFGMDPALTVESDSNYFLVPEFGYNRMVNNNLALGVTVYGNGGMNTDYKLLIWYFQLALGPVRAAAWVLT
jgi:hypothetical protein